MLLNVKDIFKKLREEYPIILSSDEKSNYENVIKFKQDEIKKYKLIR